MPKWGFGRLIDLARNEPVAMAKQGRPVVMAMLAGENERLNRTNQKAGDNQIGCFKRKAIATRTHT